MKTRDMVIVSIASLVLFPVVKPLGWLVGALVMLGMLAALTFLLRKV